MPIKKKEKNQQTFWKLKIGELYLGLFLVFSYEMFPQIQIALSLNNLINWIQNKNGFSRRSKIGITKFGIIFTSVVARKLFLAGRDPFLWGTGVNNTFFSISHWRFGLKVRKFASVDRCVILCQLAWDPPSKWRTRHQILSHLWMGPVWIFWFSLSSVNKLEANCEWDGMNFEGQ